MAGGRCVEGSPEEGGTAANAAVLAAEASSGLLDRLARFVLPFRLAFRGEVRVGNFGVLGVRTSSPAGRCEVLWENEERVLAAKLGGAGGREGGPSVNLRRSQ